MEPLPLLFASHGLPPQVPICWDAVKVDPVRNGIEHANAERSATDWHDSRAAEVTTVGLDHMHGHYRETISSEEIGEPFRIFSRQSAFGKALQASLQCRISLTERLSVDTLAIQYTGRDVPPRPRQFFSFAHTPVSILFNSVHTLA